MISNPLQIISYDVLLGSEHVVSGALPKLIPLPNHIPVT
jgi:hypothetical protein